MASVTSEAEGGFTRLELASAITNCSRCPAKWNGNGPVQFSGPNPAEVMILGEAPTRIDDKARCIKHVGEPSQLLIKTLKRHGVDIRDCFFANSVQCWTEGKGPGPNELRACSPNVSAMVKLADPKVVLAMGATALKITHHDAKAKISKVHGRPFRALAGPFIGRWIVPSWHPAALAKNKGAEVEFAADIAALGKFLRDQRREGWKT